MTLLPETTSALFFKPGADYFLSHSVGLMPKGAPAFLQEKTIQPWQETGSFAWDNWLSVLDSFHKNLSTLLNVSARSVCAQANVSSALTKIIFSVPPPADRPVILMSEQDFPTTAYVMEQAEKAGWQRRFLPRSADLTDPQVWIDAMTGDVGAVFTTHIYSNSGQRAPLKEICLAARKHDLLSILDIAQSAGCLHIDLADINPDFAVGTSVKYLCGGPGAAWLYVSPEMLPRCQPIDAGWFSHENPYGFDLHDFQYADNAWRFMGGTPSIHPFALAAHSIKTLTDIGTDRIEAHNQHLLRQMIERLPPARIISERRQGVHGSHLLFQVQEPQQAQETLKEDGLFCDVRQGALRLSVHLYTSKQEIDAATDRLLALCDL